VFGSLKNIFDISIGRFRDQLRSVVERHAKEVHSKLTTEPGYVGLKINDQYGLMLVNDQGRDILRRSAGSEQIVALSLITALNRASDREAPVVMDTPLGRLDRGHRTNILRFAGEFGPQVILLVQSGELDRERDLADIRPYLSREYKIERTGASDRSRISPIGSV
jgi:DNA sulfur modification protein DndD